MFDINAKKQRNKQKKYYEIFLSPMHGVVGTQWAPRFLVAIFLLFLWTKRNGKNIVLLEDSVSVCLSICIYHWLDYVCIEWRR